MTHVLITMLVQLGVGLGFGRWLLGGALMSFFYLGRELAQAENRWIATFGEGLRENMPPWGGFDPQIWNVKSLVDFGLPALAALAVYALALLLRQGLRRGAGGRQPSAAE